MIASGRDGAAETGDVKGPPLRNRTVLALAEVVSACFDFTINLSGNFEPRVRPDWFADFLYADEFPASVIQRARQLQPQVGAIKSFVLGLDSRAGTSPQISPVAGAVDEVRIASHRTLLKLAEGILKFARTDECLVKPGSWLVERLIAGLELDGYDLRDGNIVVREA